MTTTPSFAGRDPGISSIRQPAFSLRDSQHLVERLQARDSEALGELYDRIGGLVYTIILRVARDQGAAEDLTQDVFLRVWNRIPTFDNDRGSLFNWVLMMARSSALDFWRSRWSSKLRMTVSIDALDCPVAVDPGQAKGPSYAESRDIRAAMDRLQPRHRQLLQLAYFDGLSQTEMAAQLQLPLGTVKTAMRMALRQMRVELGLGRKATAASEGGPSQ